MRLPLDLYLVLAVQELSTGYWFREADEEHWPFRFDLVQGNCQDAERCFTALRGGKALFRADG